jgi:nitrite reductase/ring-hydroxylating ferredoxin subunit
VKDLAFELLRCIDAIHRVGLRRLNELLKVAGLQQRAVDDPEVRLLFDMYDLGEGGDESRTAAVIDSVKPGLEAMGVQIELLESTAAAIRVRLTYPAHAEQGGLDELRSSLEEALLTALPGVTRVDLDMVALPSEAQNNFVPLASLVMRPLSKLQWQPLLAIAELAPGRLRAFDLGEERVLLANLGDGEVYAYRNNCPDTPFPLDGGSVDGTTLHCPWHGCSFDLRGGRRLALPGPGLGVVPVRVDDGVIAVSVRPTPLPT